MAEHGIGKRIWGWWFFDWASQPYHTLLLTFVFGPFFASVATAHFALDGIGEQAADARAQSLWSLCLSVTGLIVGLGGPVMGALADTAGRRMPWIAGFSALYIAGSGLLWFTDPGGANLGFALVAFGVGFVGAEFALIFTNAQLPGLAERDEIGRVSGSGFAFGYFGGLVALIVALVFLVEQPGGRTLAGLEPPLGLDPAMREGTRAVGPFVALWFAVFMIPYFLWVREKRTSRRRHSLGLALGNLAASVRGLRGRPSLASFLGGSMLYRDALNGLYGFGGTYALLVLGWEITAIGAFGIASVIAAAAFSWIGGRLDRRLGPKPVIACSVVGLVIDSAVILTLDPGRVLGFPVAGFCGYLPVGGACAALPHAVFLVCGVMIGGFGGIVQAASRSLMARHAAPGAETEAFGLYGLAGRATSFLAPMLIGLVTVLTGEVRLGALPLILLFLSGLFLLRWTEPDGDRAVP